MARVLMRSLNKKYDEVHAVIDVNLEIRGARGAFAIGRLARGAFVLRRALASGASLGSAVEAARRNDPGFDPASGLTALFVEQLIVGITS